MIRTKSVLILGGSGFLGTHLALVLRDGYKVFATYHKNRMSIPGVSFFPFDVDNRIWVKRILYMTQPDVVIYVAGYNTLDAGYNDPRGMTREKNFAEVTSKKAERLHTDGPATFANFMDIVQPKFIFISNPFVFDGTKGNYREGDTVLPSNILGRMSSGGENVVRSKCLNYIILRTSPIFGCGNGYNFSFLDRYRMAFDRKTRIQLSNQEFHSYSPVYGVVDTIKRIIESGIRNKVLHYSGLTKVTPYEFARRFATKFKYDPGLCVQKEIPKHPVAGLVQDSTLDFSLNCTNITEALKIKPLLLEESLDLIEQQLITKF